MRADGVSEEMVARFVAEEMEEDEFRRGKGVTEIEALRERRILPGIGGCRMSGAPGNRDAPNRWANPSNEKVRHYRSANHAHNQEESA